MISDKRLFASSESQSTMTRSCDSLIFLSTNGSSAALSRSVNKCTLVFHKSCFKIPASRSPKNLSSKNFQYAMSNAQLFLAP